MTSVTLDSIAMRNAGTVFLSQPKRGVRFTSDSLILADFCRLKQRSRVLEPGAGTGIISLLLAKKYPHARFVADEYEPGAYNLLCGNIIRNGMQENISPCDHDILALYRALKPACFDAIVANPPYAKKGAGIANPAPERRAARHEHTSTISDWVGLQALLKNRGSYFMIFPVARLAELVALLRSKKLEPKRMRHIHASREKPASLVLIESVKAAGIGLEIMPPLFMHEPGGAYTREAADIYSMPYVPNNVNPDL